MLSAFKDCFVSISINLAKKLLLVKMIEIDYAVSRETTFTVRRHDSKHGVGSVTRRMELMEFSNKLSRFLLITVSEFLENIKGFFPNYFSTVKRNRREGVIIYL